MVYIIEPRAIHAVAPVVIWKNQQKIGVAVCIKLPRHLEMIFTAL